MNYPSHPENSKGCRYVLYYCNKVTAIKVVTNPQPLETAWLPRRTDCLNLLMDHEKTTLLALVGHFSLPFNSTNQEIEHCKNNLYTTYNVNILSIYINGE